MSERIGTVENISDIKQIENRLKQLSNDKFVVVHFSGEDKIYSFISQNLSDMDLCYIIDTLKKRRNKIFPDD